MSSDTASLAALGEPGMQNTALSSMTPAMARDSMLAVPISS